MNWIKSKWEMFKHKKKLLFSILLTVVIAIPIGIAIVSNGLVQSRGTSGKLIPASVELSKDGEVAGVSDDTLSKPTSTPTPFTTRKAIITPTPTKILTPTSTNNQSSSNNDQSSNNSSNDTNQQPQNNANNQNPSPTPTQAPTLTQEPTPTPTPDNTPFEADWNVSWNGDSVLVTVTANKPLKSCEGDIKVTSGTTVVGSTSLNGNVCTFGGGTSKCFATVWAKVTSTNDETKEFSQLRSNVDPC